MSEILRKILIDGEKVFLKYNDIIYEGIAVNNEKLGIKSNDDQNLYSPSGFCQKYTKHSCNGWGVLYVIRNDVKISLDTLRKKATGINTVNNTQRINKSTTIKNIIHKNNTTRRKKQYSHKCIPDKDLITDFPGKNLENYLNLKPYVNAVLKQVREKGQKEGGKGIYGNIIEYWFMNNIDCQRCNKREWIKCSSMTPVFDFECNNCKTVYSIKGAHSHDFLQKVIGKLKIGLCGRYTPLVNAHEKRILDWILIDYDKGKDIIKRVYYVPHEKINSDLCFFPLKPLPETAKRAGYKGSTARFSKNIFKQII